MGAILGLERLGFDPSRDHINILVVGDQAVLTQGLLAGTIDATVLDGVYSMRLHERGFPILVYSFQLLFAIRIELISPTNKSCQI